MSGYQTAEIKVFSSSEKTGVYIPHPSTCKQAKVAIAKKLGLKPQSISLFALCIGPLGLPNKILSDRDVVPVGGDFSFQRWSFDVEKEGKLCRQDDMAMHLLYCEAKHDYLHENRFKPTPAQAEELESFMDPDFPVERQFMEVLRSLPGYNSYIVRKCLVKDMIKSNICTIPKGTSIDCLLTFQKLAFVNGEETIMEWDWKVVRRWKTEGNGIEFEVCLEEINAPIMKWVSLETRQSNYLFSVASTICDIIKGAKDKAANPLPEINPALAGKVQDPLAEFINGIFHGFAPKFDSIDS